MRNLGLFLTIISFSLTAVLAEGFQGHAGAFGPGFAPGHGAQAFIAGDGIDTPRLVDQLKRHTSELLDIMESLDGERFMISQPIPQLLAAGPSPMMAPQWGNQLFEQMISPWAEQNPTLTVDYYIRTQVNSLKAEAAFLYRHFHDLTGPDPRKIYPQFRKLDFYYRAAMSATLFYMETLKRSYLVYGVGIASRPIGDLVARLQNMSLVTQEMFELMHMLRFRPEFVGLYQNSCLECRMGQYVHGYHINAAPQAYIPFPFIYSNAAGVAPYAWNPANDGWDGQQMGPQGGGLDGLVGVNPNIPLIPHNQNAIQYNAQQWDQTWSGNYGGNQGIQNRGYGRSRYRTDLYNQNGQFQEQDQTQQYDNQQPEQDLNQQYETQQPEQDLNQQYETQQPRQYQNQQYQNQQPRQYQNRQYQTQQPRQYQNRQYQNQQQPRQYQTQQSQPVQQSPQSQNQGSGNAAEDPFSKAPDSIPGSSSESAPALTIPSI